MQPQGLRRGTVFITVILILNPQMIYGESACMRACMSNECGQWLLWASSCINSAQSGAADYCLQLRMKKIFFFSDFIAANFPVRNGLNPKQDNVSGKTVPLPLQLKLCYYCSTRGLPNIIITTTTVKLLQLPCHWTVLWIDSVKGPPEGFTLYQWSAVGSNIHQEQQRRRVQASLDVIYSYVS